MPNECPVVDCSRRCDYVFLRLFVGYMYILSVLCFPRGVVNDNNSYSYWSWSPQMTQMCGLVRRKDSWRKAQWRRRTKINGTQTAHLTHRTQSCHASADHSANTDVILQPLLIQTARSGSTTKGDNRSSTHLVHGVHQLATPTMSNLLGKQKKLN